VPSPAIPSPSWRPAILAATIAAVVFAIWPFQSWSPFAIAAAAYFALPPAQRTRKTAALVGWSVGFVLTMLAAFWQALTH
jgi:hypothetical protein